MNTSSFSVLVGLSVLVGASALGCGNVISVSGPIDQETSSSSSSPSPINPEPGTGGQGGEVASYNNIAYLDDVKGVSVSLANYGQQCGGSGEPETWCSAQATWAVDFTIPNSAFVVGGTVSLQDANGFFSETLGSNGDPNDCGGGGGSFFDGNVTVLGISGDTATVQLTGTDDPFGVITDGTYTVHLCGAAPTAPTNLTSAVAVPDGNGGLTLYLTNVAGSCVSPGSQPGGEGFFEEVTIPLSADQLAPGSYPLPSGSTSWAWLSDGQDNGGGGGGTYDQGTITVISNANGVFSFSLSGTGYVYTDDVADGSYSATVCPLLD